MEQQTGSKLGKEYIKAVYCHPAYLTYMQSTSWETLDWITHKLESRLPGEISTSSHADDHYIYYCGQESLRRNRVTLIVNKSPKGSTWMQSQKQQNELGLFPRQSIQHHSNPSLCPKQNAKKAEGEWFYEDLQDLLELIPQKDVLFIIGAWNAKVGSQRYLE